ncbi:MAG: hypothetical protein Q8N05_21795 [Bacteroidota bacterium]|nr:hypothetical protein [Bacteroidota bacterium]
MKNLFKAFILLAAMGIVLPPYSVQPPDDFAKSGISAGVVVEDLSKSLDFYLNVIGMAKIWFSTAQTHLTAGSD